MKKTIAFFFSFLFASIAFGQFEWVENGVLSNDLIEIKKTMRNQYVLLLDKSGYGDPTRAKILDNLGIEIFNFSDENFGNNGSIFLISDIIEIQDSSIILPIGRHVLDVDGMSALEVENLVKFDKSWEHAIWEDSYYPFANASGASLSDGSFILYNNNFGEAFRKDNDGSDIWHKFFPNYQFIDLAITSTDTLVWAVQEALVIMNKEGEIENAFTEYQFNKVETNQWDGIVGANEDSVFLLSPSFELLATSDFSNEGIKDFAAEGDKIAVLTNDHQVYLFNDSLALQNSFEITDDSEFRFIAINPERLVLAGMETYGPEMPRGGTKAAFVKEYSFAGSDFDVSRDVGVVDIVPGATSVVTLPDQWEVIYDSLFISVQNYGDSTVNQVFIWKHSDNPTHVLRRKFENINLAPGETIVLAWPDFHIRTNVAPSGFMNICMWTSHPDKRLDNNSANDGFCSDFLVNDNVAYQNIGFDISPNPSSNKSTIEYHLPFGNKASINIFNNMGIKIDSYIIENKNGNIYLSKYPPSLYYVALEIEGEIISTLKYIQL